MKIHPVFHNNLLRLDSDDALQGQHHEPPLPIIIEDELEWEVEEILDSKLLRKKLFYMAAWKNHPLDNTCEDDEDEDVQPPIRRKQRRRESDVTENATRKKVHTRSSTIAQAQTCTTRGPTVSRSSPDDAESILGAEYQEYPLQGFLKCVRI
ncbi:hypothetical protein VC83_05409 [Pseudogymnoascus destructans]|uniref:Chromo domain-containing protein n=1 Tax=Pseudogymnoascus destructans TaxID=655981 RepID=A0A177A748_9PEZI|nr:uncharacterized protein VC83_05409 [Pseudogymnoascus destructans]OAF57988.1 hypothetical protein VC83_05409 [Pseudogymnoascus destructans]